MPGHDGEVFRVPLGQRRVLQLEHLVGGDRDPDERVERVDVLHDPDGEHRFGRRLVGAGEPGCEKEQPHNGGDRGNEAGGSMCHHMPLNLNGESGRTKYTTNDGFVQEVQRS